MKEPQITVIGYAEIIQETQRFINKHLWAVGGLSLLASTTSYIQEGGITKISVEMSYLLALSLKFFWLLLLLVVVGNGSIENGFRKIIAIFNMKVADWRAIWHQTKTNIWWNRIPLAVNLIILMIVATVMSVSIDLWVHLGLFGWLKSNHLLSEMATYLPLASLLKCLSVVPFTLVFECLLVLILVGKWPLNDRQHS